MPAIERALADPAGQERRLELRTRKHSDGRGRTGQSGPSRADRCTSTPRDPRPSRDDQGCQARVLVVIRARGRSRWPALTRRACSTCGSRQSRPLRSPRLSERSGTRRSTSASTGRRDLARSRGCVPPHPATSSSTARPAWGRAGFRTPIAGPAEAASTTGAGRCGGLSLGAVDPRQANVAVSRSIRRRNGRNLYELPSAIRSCCTCPCRHQSASDLRSRLPSPLSSWPTRSPRCS